MNSFKEMFPLARMFLLAVMLRGWEGVVGVGGRLGGRTVPKD